MADITLTCESANITARGYQQVDVEVEDVDVSDVVQSVGSKELIEELEDSEMLDHVGAEEAVKHFGSDELLQHMDVNDVRQFWVDHYIADKKLDPPFE